MKSDSCVVQRLLEHGLNVVFPNEKEIEELNRIILKELSFNIFTEESKQFYVTTMKRLWDDEHVEGIVLGCTGE